MADLRPRKDWIPLWDYVPRDLLHLLVLGAAAPALFALRGRAQEHLKGMIEVLAAAVAAFSVVVIGSYLVHQVRSTRHHEPAERWLVQAWRVQRTVFVSILALLPVNLWLLAVAVTRSLAAGRGTFR